MLNTEELFQKGKDYLDQEEYLLAYEQFQQLVELEPNNYRYWYNRGVALKNLERYEEAIASYDKALKIKPDYYYAWNSRGIILCDCLGRYEKAINSFDKAIQLEPSHYKAWVNRGIALSNLGCHEETITSCKKALEIKPDYYEAWDKIGIALSDLGKYEEAINYFNKALEIKPNDYRYWYNRGVTLSNLGRYEEAIASYDKVLEIKPDYYEAWNNRGVAAGKSRGYVAFLHTQKLNPELNKRGYEGKLASYYAGLEIIHQETHPEGWGYLHHKIGKAQYFKGQQKANSGLKSSWDYWRQAENSYKTALLTLKPPKFLELYLEVLKDLIRVLLNLKEIQEAQELQRQGTDVLRRILEDSKQTENSQEKLTRKLARFTQSTVDMVVKSGYLAEALILAEAGKNICLRWLLGIVEIPEVEYSQIQSFLNSTTAAVYWHQSPAALTTFIIKSNCPAPILINHPRTNSELSEAAQRLIEFEEWMEDWDKQYSDYRQQPKDKRNKNHPWRDKMQQRLFERKEKPGNLKEILNITEIERYLTGIENLILMPHRDLHRFPIHALFSSQFTITYLPSFQMGMMLQNRQFNENEGLLSIENPSRDLRFARVEAEGIGQYVEPVKSIQEKRATKKKLKTNIDKNYSVFHFAGHAEHIPENPQQSRLKLSYDDHDPEQDLTLADLPHNAFAGYSLVTLSACETALTNNQTITSEYVGLVSGFLRSGAAQVVSTLWTVESGASALLMIEFYRQRLSLIHI